jgi:hypothetical protein
MKVGEERIDSPKSVTRGDRQIRDAILSKNFSGLCNRRFERARCRGAHRYDSPSPLATVIDDIGGFVTDRESFREHMMVGDIGHAHRLESSVSDM